MKHISIRVPDELYHNVVSKADEASESLSNFVRTVVQQTCENGHTNGSDNHPALEILCDQLRAKDAQIAELTTEVSESRKRSDTIIAQMTTQIDRANLQLEDLRTRKSWWQRLVGSETSTRRNEGTRSHHRHT
jgi:negative regulator of replication initiation